MRKTNVVGSKERRVQRRLLAWFNSIELPITSVTFNWSGEDVTRYFSRPLSRNAPSQWHRYPWSARRRQIRRVWIGSWKKCVLAVNMKQQFCNCFARIACLFAYFAFHTLYQVFFLNVRTYAHVQSKRVSLSIEASSHEKFMSSWTIKDLRSSEFSRLR